MSATVAPEAAAPAFDQPTYLRTVPALEGPGVSWWRQLCNLRPADPVGPAAALVGWATQLLLQELPDRALGVCQAVESARDALWQVGLAGGRGPTGAPAALVVADQRLVGVTGCDRAYDVCAGAAVSPLRLTPAACFRVVTYNLAALAQGHAERLARAA